MNARCQAFRINTNDFKKETLYKNNVERGVRIGQNLNYIVFKNYLALGHSYLTMVLQDQKHNSGNDIESAPYDYEAFSYIIDHKTEFHDIATDYDGLAYLLQNYQKHDKRLL